MFKLGDWLELLPKIFFSNKNTEKTRGESLLQIETFICKKNEHPIHFDNRVNTFMLQPWCEVKDVKVNLCNENGHTMHVVTVLYTDTTKEHY